MELERTELDIAGRQRPEISKEEKLACHIGRKAFRAFMAPERTEKRTYLHRRKLTSGEKIWETHWVIVMDDSWVDGGPKTFYTLVAPRKGRKRPAADTLLRLVHNNDYGNPVAYIKPPTEGQDAVVIVNDRPNHLPDLQQIAPLIDELNGSWYVHPDQIPSPEPTE